MSGLSGSFNVGGLGGTACGLQTKENTVQRAADLRPGFDRIEVLRDPDAPSGVGQQKSGKVKQPTPL